MAYVKPGVEITQVQRTFSPTLIAPDLPAAVVGPAYTIVPLEGTGSYNYGYYTSDNQTVTLSGVATDSHYAVDENSVFADLVLISGANAGNRLHISASDLSYSNGTITLTSGVAALETWAGARVLVGYRALSQDPKLADLLEIQGTEDFESRFGVGQVHIDNPLGLAVNMAMANTRGAVYAVALGADEFASATVAVSGVSVADEHTRALDVLGASDAYAIAPMTTEQLSVWRSHVDLYSVPTEKRERITFLNPYMELVTDGNLYDKATMANTLRDTGYATVQKRVFHVVPDVVYILETGRHVTKISEAYNSSLFSNMAGEYCILAKTYRLANGSYYKRGTLVTDLVYADLKADTNYYQFDVYVPVPGVFLTAAIAGQVSGQFPEQGFTNLPLAGPAKLKYSNDFFTESQLNVIAQGGNYIMVDTNGVISCRHQLSTNMTSIETRELNITKSVDFAAKYIRNTVAGYIGRSLITPAFLQVLGTIISGLGSTLVKEGRLNGFKLTGIKQDDVSKDTVLVSIEILPKYPVNYIKIDLIF